MHLFLFVSASLKWNIQNIKFNYYLDQMSIAKILHKKPNFKTSVMLPFQSKWLKAIPSLLLLTLNVALRVKTNKRKCLMKRILLQRDVKPCILLFFANLQKINKHMCEMTWFVFVKPLFYLHLRKPETAQLKYCIFFYMQ